MALRRVIRVHCYTVLWSSPSLPGPKCDTAVLDEYSKYVGDPPDGGHGLVSYLGVRFPLRHDIVSDSVIYVGLHWPLLPREFVLSVPFRRLLTTLR